MAKIISIISTVTLVSFAFWYSAEPWVNSYSKFSDLQIWLFPCIVLIVFGALIANAFMLLPKKRYMVLTSFLIGGTYLIAFGFGYLALVAFFLIPMLHSLAIRLIQLESKERLKIHSGLIISRGVTFIMVPLYFALSIAYFSSPSIQLRAQGAVLPPSLIEATEQVMDKFLAQEKFIPLEQRQEVRSLALEKILSAITSAVDPYRQYFPSVLALGMFFILWSLGFFLRWLVEWTGMLFFWLLKRFNFVQISTQQIEAEKILLI